MGKTVWAVYFSPAGGTRRAAVFMAKRMAERLGAGVKEIDFTRMENRGRTYEFSENDVVVFGSPVYAGRIPNKIMPDWKRCFAGGGAAAAAVCTFGNRNYDGALDEFHLILQQSGFRVVAKAAVVCRHVFSGRVGTGRPCKEDWEEIREFADKIAEQSMQRPASGRGEEGGLRLPEDFTPKPYYTPLKADGTPAKFLKAKPLTGGNCSGCGLCASLCPMGSIDADDPRTVSGVCIKCQACVLGCPAGAKYFADEDFLSHVRMLEENYTRPGENEFFYA